MSDNQPTNGLRKPLEDWSQINWRKINKMVKNLRRRIFLARRLGNWRKLRNLQKLLQRSYANLLLATRKITQTNSGKATAGIDQETINTPEERVKLVNSWKGGNQKPTKRVMIPKTKGKKRPLGIPTVKDRIEQAIIANALEPEWEAVFEPNSYGFRPGRSCQDAIGQIFNLTSRWHTEVLEADIEGFFDNIAHQAIMNQLGNYPKRDLIEKWLKAGYIFKGEYFSTETGTPQGGVISPLLANIGLHGLETHIKSINPKLGVVRYADDFVVTAREKENLEKIIEPIQQWLEERGLSLNQEKTLLTSMDKGFNFLGFNSRHYNGKLLIKPQKDKVLNFVKRIGNELRNMKDGKQEEVIKKLNPILQGFANYYKGVVSKQVFSYISHKVKMRLWKWAKRRHPKKGRKWIYNRYFKTLHGRKWVFATTIEDRKNTRMLELFEIGYVTIERQVKVKGDVSVDDPTQKDYWEQRNTKQGKSYWERNTRNYKIAKNQGWKCPICGEPIINGEETEIHHIVPVVKGGLNDIENLQHLHKACHKQVHTKTPVKKMV